MRAKILTSILIAGCCATISCSGELKKEAAKVCDEYTAIVNYTDDCDAAEKSDSVVGHTSKCRCEHYTAKSMKKFCKKAIKEAVGKCKHLKNNYQKECAQLAVGLAGSKYYEEVEQVCNAKSIPSQSGDPTGDVVSELINNAKQRSVANYGSPSYYIPDPVGHVLNNDDYFDLCKSLQADAVEQCIMGVEDMSRRLRRNAQYVEADFNGDGIIDKAAIVVSNDRSLLQAAAYLGAQYGNYNKLPLRNLEGGLRETGYMIETAEPGAHETLCKDEECDPGMPKSVDLKNPGIIFGQDESWSILYYWNANKKAFDYVPLSD